MTSLPEILNAFSIETMPIFWVRLVCSGSLCNELLRTVGAQVGFGTFNYDIGKLVKPTRDDFFTTRTAELEQAFAALAATKL